MKTYILILTTALFLSNGICKSVEMKAQVEDSTSMPSHPCDLRFQNETGIGMVFTTCSNQTGFPPQMDQPPKEGETWIDTAEKNGFEDKCLSECFFKGMGVVKSDGFLLENEKFVKVFSPLGSSKYAVEMTSSMKTCLDLINTEAKSNKGMNCKLHMKAMVCMMTASNVIQKKCIDVEVSTENPSK